MKFLILFVSLSFNLLCIAQDKKEPRTCRAIFLDRPRDAPTEAYLFDGEKSHKISLSGMNFSEVIELPEGDLTLGLTTSPVTDPKDFPEGAPTVAFPESATDLYLIVGSDLSNPVIPVRMVKVNVSGARLKPGETLWVNLTEDKIIGKLGSERLIIEPKARVVGKPPRPDSGYYKAIFAYQAGGRGEVLPIMKKSWWLDTRSKNLGFVIKTGSRLPRIFTFRDHRTSVSADE